MSFSRAQQWEIRNVELIVKGFKDESTLFTEFGDYCINNWNVVGFGTAECFTDIMTRNIYAVMKLTFRCRTAYNPHTNSDGSVEMTEEILTTKEDMDDLLQWIHDLPHWPSVVTQPNYNPNLTQPNYGPLYFGGRYGETPVLTQLKLDAPVTF